MEKGLVISVSIGIAAAVSYFVFTNTNFFRRSAPRSPARSGSSASDLGFTERKTQAKEEEAPKTPQPDTAGLSSESSGPVAQANSSDEKTQPGQPPQDVASPPGTPALHHPATFSAEEPSSDHTFVPSTAQINYGRFRDYYDRLNLLGRGACSSVYKCKHHATGEIRAVKNIDLRKLQVSQRFREERVLEEVCTMGCFLIHVRYYFQTARPQVRILQSLKHPNIVQIFDVFKSDSHLHIVMEFAQVGGTPMLRES